MLNSWLELTICRDSSSAGPCLPGEGRTSVLGVNTLNRMRLLDRGAGGGAVHRTSAPSAPCFTWASPPVPRCERPRKRRSQELPQGRGGGWSRGRAAPALPRLRLSFSSRGVLAPHADEALERQHWAPRGLTPPSPPGCESTPLTEAPTQCFFFLSPFGECKETLSHVFNEIKTFPGYTRAEPQTNRTWENPCDLQTHAQTYTQRRGIKTPWSRNATSPREHSGKFISITSV